MSTDPRGVFDDGPEGDAEYERPFRSDDSLGEGRSRARDRFGVPHWGRVGRMHPAQVKAH